MTNIQNPIALAVANVFTLPERIDALESTIGGLVKHIATLEEKFSAVDQLIQALNAQGEAKPAKKTKKATATEVKADLTPAPSTAAVAPESEPAPVAEPAKVNDEEFRAVVMHVSSLDKARALELLKQFGISKMSELKEADKPAFFTAAKALETELTGE